ncbi:MAG: ribose 5-phosphate isomerase B [Ruminococcus sp.]|jgi:ribose 5-phosphate isomerase B|nr:ribose 5-phosphate isomerase B [Ruminococcus sp.]
MNIIIGNDHTGFDLKNQIISTFQNANWINIGCEGEQIDYPDIAKELSNKIISSHEIDFGILICGTGIGMSIAANKIPGIRAAVCSEHFSAKYARLHNDANVLCLGARVIGNGIATELVDVFINTQFEGGRHRIRIDKFS